MKCGYCPDEAVVWIEWPTIGRPKGAPVCNACFKKRYTPDNFGDYPILHALLKKD